MKKIAFIILFLSFLGCTREVTNQSTVRLKFPVVSNSSKSSQKISTASIDNTSTGPNWNTSIVASSISEINCYAIFIGGPELTQNRCYDTATGYEFKFGTTFAGFFSPGAEIALTMDPGDGRVIYVAGMKANTGGCIAGTLENNLSPEFQKLSEPQVIGQSASTNIVPGDQQISIGVDLDSSKKFQHCDFIQSGNGDDYKGLAFLTTDRTENASTPLDLAPSTAEYLSWTSFIGDSNLFTSANASNSTMTVAEAGNYFMAAHYTVNTDSQRAMHNLVGKVNGSASAHMSVMGNYIRGSSGHVDGNLNLYGVVPLVAGDQLQMSVDTDSVNIAGSYTYGHSALYLEQLDSNRKFFSATASQTNAGANFNPASDAAVEWQQIAVGSGSMYTHSNSTNPEQITLNNSGYFLVTVNLPLDGAITRAAPVVKLKLNGSPVSGVMGANCYIRSVGSDDQCQLSFATYFQGNSGDVVTLEVVNGAAVGTVGLQASRNGSIFIDEIDPSDAFMATGSTLEGVGTDFNTASGAAIEWSTVDSGGGTHFTHDSSGSPQEIVIQDAGNYLVVYNDVMTSAVQRPNNEVLLVINGIHIDSSKVSSHYIRNSSGHTISSGSFIYLLSDLNEGDIVEVKSRQAGASGTVTAQYPARIAVIKKP